MNIFGYYIEKKTLFYIVVVILLIILGIISVNVRIEKNRIASGEFVGYVPDEGDDPQFYGDADMAAGQIALYDFSDIIPYFKDFEGAMEFKDYLINYVTSSGTNINEWWVTSVAFNNVSKELSFYLRTNGASEYYYIKKSGTSSNDTYIQYVHK